MNPGREWSSSEYLPRGFTEWLSELVREYEGKEKKEFRQIAIELGVNPISEAVNYPWQMVVEMPDRPPLPVTSSTKIIDIFDELNRAKPKVRNAVMELIQFRSINGIKFNNLRMIWAAINP